MSRDKIIEEMAQIVSRWRDEICTSDCQDCEYYGEWKCHEKGISEAFRKAGYRKVTKDERLFTARQLRDELERHEQEIARDILHEIMSVETTSENFVKNTEFYEFVQKVLGKLEELADKYGVKLE